MSADDAIRIRVTETGALQAAKEFDALRKSIVGVDEQAKASTTEQQKRTDAIKAQIKEVKALAYEEKYRTELLATNAAKSLQAMGTISSASQVANTNAGEFKKTVTDLGGIVGKMGQTFAAVAPQVGELGQAAATAGGAFANIAGLMGEAATGPLGLAIAGITIAFTGLGAIMRDDAKDAATLAKKIAEIPKAPTFSDRLGTANTITAEAELRARLKSGKGSVQEYMAAESETADRVYALQQRVTASSTRGSLTKEDAAAAGQLKNAQAELADLQVRLKNAQDLQSVNAAAGSGAVGKDIAPAAARKEGDAYAREQANLKSIANLKKAQEDAAAAERATEARTYAARKQLQRQAYIDADVASSKSAQAQRKVDDEAFAHREKLLKREHDLRMQYGQMALQLGETVASSGIKAMSELAKGHKVSVAKMIEGIGDAMVASGSRYIFEGAASILLGNPGGPALIGIGTAEVAAGIALGAAGARGGAGGARGAGGGSGPASPVRDYGNRSPQVGGNVTYLTLNSTMPVKPEEALRLQQVLNSGKRVYGKQAFK